METVLHTDPHEQLCSLYRSLLNRQENLDEFRELLSQYPPVAEDDTEPLSASEVRERLNQRIRQWTGRPFGWLLRGPDAHVAGHRGRAASRTSAVERIKKLANSRLDRASRKAFPDQIQLRAFPA